jgi:hypothetical protein
MRVLLLESEPGVAHEAEAELTGAGHAVARCHDAASAPFPCYGITDPEENGGHRCPLDEGSVDVAVVVHRAAEPAGRVSSGEDGARCALRRHVPVVIAGPVEHSTIADFATMITSDGGPIAPLIEQAAAAPLLRHSTAARRSLRSVMEIHGLPVDGANAEAFHDQAGLRVVLRPGVELDEKTAEVASIRAAGAVRDVDPYAPTVNVVVEPPG